MKTKDNKLTTDNGQKQAELVMQTSLQLLPLIMNNIPQAVFWKDCDLIYLGCNQAFAEDAGFSSPAEIVGKTDFDMPWTDQAELYRADDRRVMEYGEAKNNYEEPQTTPNGSTIWLSTSKIPVRENGQVIAVLGMYEDITGRKQAEKALQASEQQFHTLYDNATIGLYRTTPDGRILMLNPVGVRMLGYDSFDEIAKRNLEDTGFERDDARKEFREKLESEGSLIGFESSWVRKDGSTIFVRESAKALRDENGKVLYYDGSFEDITERKQAEAAVSESEDRFRRFTEVTVEGLVFHELGRIIDANPAALAMFGISDNDEFIGRNLMEFIVPESHKLVLQQMQLETVLPYEIQCVCNDGTIFPVETSTRTYKVGDRTIRASSIRDITERKQSDQALRESRQLLQMVMDNIPQAVFWKDKGLAFLGANQAFAKDAGLNSPQDLIGKTDFGMPWKEQAELYRADDRQVLEFGETKLNFEEPHTGPTGEISWVRTSKIPMRDVNGNIFAVLGMYEDITESKREEQALLHSQQLLQTVMDNIPLSVFWKDTQLNYLGCNRAFAADVALASPNDVIGKSDFDMPSADRAEHYRADDSLVINSGIPKLNYEEPQTTPDGTTNWLRTNKIPMRDADGKICAMLGMYEDITEQKRLQHKVEELFERRGYQVQISTEISQEIAAASEIGDLFGRVVTLTKERLGYYHTQLLRYDAAQDAVVLISGYGETGQKMLASGHKLPMGSGLIGTAAASGQTVLRPTLTEDPDWQPNPLLLDTQGEIAVPIKLGEQVLGVLDVQSDRAGALTEDDRLLLEGLCGQVAVAIEQTRLRQEMAERLEEVNRLYRTMSREGWKTYRDTADLPAGFMFDQAGLKPVDETVLADELFTNVSMRVLGGEVVGTLTVANDPQHPTSPEDYAFLQQVSEQVALALEGARLSAQTQSALAQSENLFESSRRLSQAADLQELVKATIETLNIPVINRAILGTFNYNTAGELEGMTIAANWWNGIGTEVDAIGKHYSAAELQVLSLFLSATPLFFNDVFHDERVDPATLQVAKAQNICGAAVLPLLLGAHQLGIVLMESEEPHNFTQDEIRMFSALAPQIATVLENRRQYERAQQQADRESTLNIISQKIQSATTVEAVLQIAARELGHALGAPMTIAQLSMKDKK
jgi:PAS domain S-box-containing protein